jgi:hypothetical protein
MEGLQFEILGERTHDTIVVILQEAAIAADC